MNDKSWLLNASAINAAKTCVKIVDRELGVRLTLSHPQFLTLLQDYCSLTDSLELRKAVSKLRTFAKTEVVAKREISSIASGKSSIGKIASNFNARTKEFVNGGSKQIKTAEIHSISPQTNLQGSAEEELVVFHGKSYPKFQEGKTFQGLYRGRPRYS